jgi:hypothetical protein
MKTRYVTVKYPLNPDGTTITDIDFGVIWATYCMDNFPFKAEDSGDKELYLMPTDYDDFDEPVAINVTDKFLIMTFAFDVKEKEAE